MLILSTWAVRELLHRLFSQQMKLPHTKKSGLLTKYLIKVLTLQFAGWSWLLASNSQHLVTASRSCKVTHMWVAVPIAPAQGPENRYRNLSHPEIIYFL